MAENIGVEIKSISKHYGKTIALDTVDLSIPKGSFTVLLGPSGSGKTTLLSILGGFVEPTTGQIFIDGQDVTKMSPAKRPTSTVFQDYALFPHMNVFRNVAFGLAMRGVDKKEQRHKVDYILEIVGLGDMADRGIHQLSGGQRQRVALARSLVVEPSVLLLDEPLGALDLGLRRQMQNELTAIQRRVGTTFVHVTHDQDEAMSIADTIVVLNKGQIEDSGSPQRVYLKPHTHFTANFMGESNIIDATVTSKNNREITVETAFGNLNIVGDAEIGMNVHLALRPEQIQAHESNTATLSLGKVRLDQMTFIGTQYNALAIHDESKSIFKITLPQQTQYRVGDSIALSASPEDLVLLAD